MAPEVLTKNKDFNKLWAGQTVSNVGDRVSRIALPTIAIMDLGGGPVEVGVLAALGSLPFLLFGPLAGAWVDRMPRRTVLIAADAGRLLALGSIPVAYLLDMLTMEWLFVVAGLVGMLTLFFEIAYQAYLPMLIRREELMQGNQRLEISRSLANVGGAGVAGVLMQVLGNALAVLVDALSFLVSLVGIVAIKHREPAREPSQRRAGQTLKDMRGGFAAINEDGRLRSLMLLTAVVNLASGIASTLVLLYAYSDGGLNPLEVGIAFAIGGIGMVTGAVLAPRISTALSLSGSLATAVVLEGLAILILPLAGGSMPLAALVVSQLVLGFGFSLYQVVVLSTVQMIIPVEMLGRINGVALSVIWGTATFGGVLAAALGAWLGARGGLLLAGGATVLSVLLVLATPLRAMRTLSESVPSGSSAS